MAIRRRSMSYGETSVRQGRCGVNHSAGPLVEGWEPARLISMPQINLNLTPLPVHTRHVVPTSTLLPTSCA